MRKTCTVVDYLFCRYDVVQSSGDCDVIELYGGKRGSVDQVARDFAEGNWLKIAIVSRLFTDEILVLVQCSSEIKAILQRKKNAV